MYQPDLIIYHNPCNDGFASAWACWKKWGYVPKYHPANYGHKPPCVKGKNVLIVDFSYKHDAIVELAKDAKSIVVLDHHKTAEEELKPFAVSDVNADNIETVIENLPTDKPKVIALFDMFHSGAVLSWEFCFPNEPTHMLAKMVEDRDLWKFELADTKAFDLILRTIPQTFEAWDELASKSFEESSIEANAMLKYHTKLVDNISDKAEWLVKDGRRFLAVNCPSVLSSDVCNAILTKNLDTPFAASWSESTNYRGWSLRSSDDREDVSAIAKSYGGGGHRNASGFSEMIDHMQKKMAG